MLAKILYHMSIQGERLRKSVLPSTLMTAERGSG